MGDIRSLVNERVVEMLKDFFIPMKLVKFPVRIAEDVVVGKFLDIIDTVGNQRTVVARPCLVSLETVTIILHQSVACAEPYISISVLQSARDIALHQTIGNTVSLDLSMLLRPYPRRNYEED